MALETNLNKLFYSKLLFSFFEIFQPQNSAAPPKSAALGCSLSSSPLNPPLALMINWNDHLKVCCYCSYNIFGPRFLCFRSLIFSQIPLCCQAGVGVFDLNKQTQHNRMSVGQQFKCNFRINPNLYCQDQCYSQTVKETKREPCLSV